MSESCILCEPKYFLNKDTKKCVAIPETFQIENCEFYENQTAC